MSHLTAKPYYYYYSLYFESLQGHNIKQVVTLTVFVKSQNSPN